MSTVAEVRLWGRTIGAVALDEGDDCARFQYDPDFARSGIEVAPLAMPLSGRVYAFPELARESFHGLPGLLADALPDSFGNTLIDAWLATQGRQPGSFDAVERLCYVGARGMGALEFRPSTGPRATRAAEVHVDALVALASDVLSHRRDLQASFADDPAKAEALRGILRVGTSAAGARAKALVAWNETTGEVRSGQADASPGFSHWLLKLDGVVGNRDRELDDPQGFGAIEYAYHLMALEAGIAMTRCRLLEEGGRRHFMTRRFDRLEGGGKLHMASLGGLAHFDYNRAGAHGYEQALQVVRRLGLPAGDVEALFRRMCFNIVARNQDDHVKNIAFLMDRAGRWSLAPAFDLSYAHNPAGAWTSRHQMSLNGKRDGFDIGDFRACARSASMKRGRAEAILDQVTRAVSKWRQFADAAAVPGGVSAAIGATHRLGILPAN
ncbi:type II toxin-antitoxin system HipA family toxin [Luteimonas pelagia]